MGHPNGQGGAQQAGDFRRHDRATARNSDDGDIPMHPKILEAAVVGVPDPEWGETLRAFIVLRNGEQLDEKAVVEYCREGLADYKRPRKVTFLAELPRNPTGKILKRELRSMVIDEA